MTDIPLDPLDEFREAWKRLDRAFAAQQALAFQVFREGRIRSLRRRLWPLYGGQIVQMILGAATIGAGVWGWTTYSSLPQLVVAGAILHVYGVALVIAAARTFWFLSRIDYAAPVVSIQRQLADLGAWHGRANLWLGLAWWFLWMPCLMVGAAAAGVDVWRHAPLMFALGSVIGVVGLLWMTGAWRLAGGLGGRWRPALSEDAIAGASLRRARAVLGEIRRFEGESDAMTPTTEGRDSIRD